MFKICLLSILFIGCSAIDKDGTNYIDELENLTVHSADPDPADTIYLQHELNYGSTEETLIGSVNGIAIDDYGRIFIADPEQFMVHVFHSNGSYLANIGSKGSGPGEFRSLSSMTIQSEELSIYDAIQFKINVYSLDSLSLSHTIPLNPRNQSGIEELKGLNPSQVLLRSDGKYLLGFSSTIYTDPSLPNYNLEEERYSLYYLMDDEGTIISDQILKQKEMESLTATVDGEFRFTAFEFLGKSLITLSEDNYTYSARTEDFLIKVHDPNGKYQYAFYYPLSKSEFTKDDAAQREGAGV